MKKVVIFCLGLFSLPTAIYSKTHAYSPSISGQPLIFHTSAPSISPLEQKIFEQLSAEQLGQLYQLSFNTIRLLTGVGLVGSHFLSIEPKQKTSVADLYNQNIASAIKQIEKEFTRLCLAQLTVLMDQTLTSFVQIANQMLLDASTELYQEDYQRMQIEVINHFKKGVGKLFPYDSYLKAEAVSSLEGMVSCLSLYITGSVSLVDEGDPVPQNMVFARQKLIMNLTNFVEATFALQAITIHKRGDCSHGK